jgi:6-phosphogluconate dehydrogenase
MQALAEGFDILRNAGRSSFGSAHCYDFDVADIAELWRRGSVVSSWLLDLTAAALAQDQKPDAFAGHVADSGEGRWTIAAAIDEGVPVPVLATALFERFSSQGRQDFGNRVLSAMRKEFGGHVEMPRQGDAP